MTNSERAWLRCEFAKGFMRGDTYIAFTELAMRLLRPGGAYALVLPAQALSSQMRAAFARCYPARRT